MKLGGEVVGENLGWVGEKRNNIIKICCMKII